MAYRLCPGSTAFRQHMAWHTTHSLVRSLPPCGLPATPDDLTWLTGHINHVLAQSYMINKAHPLKPTGHPRLTWTAILQYQLATNATTNRARRPYPTSSSGPWATSTQPVNNTVVVTTNGCWPPTNEAGPISFQLPGHISKWQSMHYLGTTGS